jgi:hypothetical protein
MRQAVWHTQIDQIQKCLDLKAYQKKSSLKIAAPLVLYCLGIRAVTSFLAAQSAKK